MNTKSKIVLVTAILATIGGGYLTYRYFRNKKVDETPVPLDDALKRLDSL